MNPSLPLSQLWVYLSADPLCALALTISAYYISSYLYEKSGRNPLVNPVAIAVVLVLLGISWLDMPYEKYFKGAQFIHFLLGTATVSLAIPIYQGFNALRGKVSAIAIVIVTGGTVSVVSAVGFATWLGAGDNIIGSMYAKSVTAPIAMGIAERIHASPSLTAVSTVLTGMLGAILAKYILNAVQVKPWWMRGVAIGVASHGIGVARAFSVNQEAGAFASMAMGLHGVLTAIVLPLVLHYLHH